MNTLNMFEGQESTFTSFLVRKGLNRQGLSNGMSTDNFRVIGSNKVMWPIKGMRRRKGEIVSHTGGSTPGLGGGEFTLKVNTSYFNKNDNLELTDRDSLLHVLSKEKSGDNTWDYRVKYVSNNSSAFCRPTLLVAGKEIGFGHTMFPELSEDAGERHTGHEWNAEFLTIQRMKHTISGSANAMKMWMEHNGVKIWDYSQNIDMLRDWAGALEHQILFGKATVTGDSDGTSGSLLQDDDGRDLIAGNGLIAQGDASLRYYYNTLTIRWLERVMMDLQNQQGADGVLEVAVCGGQAFMTDLQRLFRDVLQQNPTPMVETNKDGMGIKTAFSWYEFNGVRLYFMKCFAFDDPTRPIDRDANGVSYSSRRAFFVALGNTVTPDATNIDLIALGNGENDRRFVARVIEGMTGKGSDTSGGTDKYRMASNPVDGRQVHVLSQTGVILKNPRGFAQLLPTRLN